MNSPKLLEAISELEAQRQIKGFARSPTAARRKLDSEHRENHESGSEHDYEAPGSRWREVRKAHGRLIVNVPVNDVQCDEIWSFCKKKEAHKRPSEAHDKSIGDAYCFVAIERKTKLVLNFALGRRDQATTDIFIEGLRAATSPQRFQITTDGFQPYISAITTTLHDRCDYAMQIKIYANSKDDHRYSPGDVVDTEEVPVMGNPDTRRICTSHVERQNLTIRMAVRRLTRLTNAFSKKWENLWAAYCLHFAYYNFCRIHKTLRVTPAMESNISDHVWDMVELIGGRGNDGRRAET